MAVAAGCGGGVGDDEDNIINARKMYSNFGITVTVICVHWWEEQHRLFVRVLFVGVIRSAECIQIRHQTRIKMMKHIALRLNEQK